MVNVAETEEHIDYIPSLLLVTNKQLCDQPNTAYSVFHSSYQTIIIFITLSFTGGLLLSSQPVFL